jgi:hypothetical protein
MTAREMLAAFAARSLSLVEAFDACVARIEARNGELHAFVALDLDRARSEVLRRQRVLEGMRPGMPLTDTWPLFGVPVGVKDLFDTMDLETAYGSPMFAGRVPDRDAEVVRRLRKAGAIVIGKTATHEFAWGITMRHDSLEPTRNPFVTKKAVFGAPDYFTDDDVAIAKKRQQVLTAFQLESATSLAHPVATLWSVAGLDYYMGYVDNVRAQTPVAVRRFVPTYLAGKPMTVNDLVSPATRRANRATLDGILSKWGVE